MRRKSRPSPTCQRGCRHEGVWPFRAQQVVAVPAGQGPPAGVEAGWRPRRLADHDVGGEHLVDGALDPGQVSVRP